MNRILLAAAAASLLSAVAPAQITAANDDCFSAYAPALTGGAYTTSTIGAGDSGLLASGLPAYVNPAAADTACQPFAGADPGDLHQDVFAWVQPSADGSYRFSTCGTASYDTKLAIYSGTCGEEQALACNEDGTGCSAFSSELNVTGLISNQTYLLQVGGYGVNDVGSATLTMSQTGSPPVAPPNNTCMGALPLLAGPNSSDTSQATSSGTLASGLAPFCNYNPDRACSDSDDLGRDVWFQFTPTTSGDYTFTTCGTSNYDNKLAIYAGSCGSLNALACADLADPATGCGFPIDAILKVSGLTAGTTYYLQVGGFSNQRGSCSITATAGPLIVQPVPANDTCTGALTLSPGPNPVSTLTACPSGVMPSGLPPFIGLATTNTACDDFGGGSSVSDDMGSDVFYSFTPALGGTYLFSACGTLNYDSKLALYSGTCDALTPLACNDDGQIGATACSAFTSLLEAPGLLSGVTYTVQLGGFNAASGSGTLDVSLMGPGTLGANYCTSLPNDVTPNGSTTGALISAAGSTSMLANNLVLRGGPMKANEPGILYHGTARLNGGLGLPFGDGLRCVGGITVRYFPPVFSNSSGLLVQPVDNTALIVNLPGAPLFAGALRHFQFWYRSPAGPYGNGGQAGFNLTDAISLLFTP